MPRFAQRLPQRLSTETEDLLHEAREIRGNRPELILPRHPHQRRFNLRRWPECLRGKGPKNLDSRQHLRRH
jgi:hypothetical protein